VDEVLKLNTKILNLYSYDNFYLVSTQNLNLNFNLNFSTSTDTATASVRGPLTNKRQGAAASTDYTTYGWFGGGATYTPAGTISIVERITYATDTTATSTRGPLSSARYDLCATSGVQ
jgi:hypothetical protein